MKESQRKGLISVHVAVALFGFVGLFAKLVDLPAVIIVLGRVFFSSIFLWIFLRLKKQKIRLEEKSDYLWMVGAGAVLAIHWSSYMQSIQSSTVAVGTLTVSTFPIFVIFLEPYLFHEKLKKSDVFCTLMMLVGVFFIVPAFQMCREEGYDVTKEWIPVVPAQHYFMGGIWVDSDSRTSMEHLYAVGETSCNGVHGANRLASNSLLESLVFAKRAAHKISGVENAVNPVLFCKEAI